MTEEEFNKLIESLHVDLRIYEEMIKEVSGDMISQGFTQHPVFIATAHEIKMGELILNKDDYAGSFNIYATTMQELLEKGLILETRRAEFEKTYKDPKKFMCVMLITQDIASFVFLPYKI